MVLHRVHPGNCTMAGVCLYSDILTFIAVLCCFLYVCCLNVSGSTELMARD